MVELIKRAIYGLISGFSDIVPVSSRGHQAVLMQLFGMNKRDPVLDLLVHIGIFAGVFFCCRAELTQFRQSLSTPKKRRSANKALLYEYRFLIMALLPLVVGLLFYKMGTKYESKPLSLALFMLINGAILFIPDYMRQSNKNAGHMGLMDSVLIGLSSIFCIFPGISRIGVGSSLAIARGADKQNAFNWLLLLTLPSMVVMAFLDLIGIFTVGLVSISAWVLAGYVIAAVAAFFGSYIAIIFMRFLTVNSGISGFAYYSWGAAAFTFIIYLVAY